MAKQQNLGHFDFYLGNIKNFPRNVSMYVSSRYPEVKNPLSGYCMNCEKYSVNDKIVLDFIGAHGVMTRAAKDVIGRRASDSAEYIHRSGRLKRGWGVATFYNNELCYYWVQPSSPVRNDGAMREAEIRHGIDTKAEPLSDKKERKIGKKSKSDWNMNFNSLNAKSVNFFYKENDKNDIMYNDESIKRSLKKDVYYDGLLVVVFNRVKYAEILQHNTGHEYKNHNSSRRYGLRDYKVFSKAMESDLYNRLSKFADPSFGIEYGYDNCPID